jgi:hypothetical protein
MGDFAAKGEQSEHAHDEVHAHAREPDQAQPERDERCVFARDRGHRRVLEVRRSGEYSDDAA